jgi:NAD+--asparagine ADP-ribosyltransferase
MKVGEYARTNFGCICKIVNINEFREPSMKYGVEASYLKDIMFIGDENIIESSPNIIDLIEENDILKIEEQKGVYTICEVEEFRDPYVNYKFLGVRLENQSRARKLYELNIKSIVTKEQFSRMEYKVNE